MICSFLDLDDLGLGRSIIARLASIFHRQLADLTRPISLYRDYERSLPGRAPSSSAPSDPVLAGARCLIRWRQAASSRSRRTLGRLSSRRHQVSLGITAITRARSGRSSPPAAPTLHLRASAIRTSQPYALAFVTRRRSSTRSPPAPARHAASTRSASSSDRPRQGRRRALRQLALSSNNSTLSLNQSTAHIRNLLKLNYNNITHTTLLHSPKR